jgi:hypothetical protein
MPEYFPEDNTPLPLDTEVRSLQKINDLLKAGVGISLQNSGLGSDAFGRLRVSNPITLFDSSHRYTDNDLWSTSVASGGSATFSATEGLVNLTVNNTSGSQVLRETTKVFAYQPGKSLLTLSTFVMAPAKNGLTQRVGYFGTQNGIFLQLENSTLSFVERSLSTGTTSTITQANWNGDKLNGTGPSGLTLDITRAQILWMDFEWLGLGTVRCGFVINGQFITCHSFHHANLITTTYITTASLPLRYEITNTGATSGSSTLKQVCSTVISEGGYQLYGAQKAAGTVITAPYSLSVAGTYYPIVSIRLKSGRLDAIAILTALSILPSESNNYNWRVYANGVTNSGSWVDPLAAGSVEYNITGTGLDTTNARILASGFISQSNQGGSSTDILKEALFRFQLERNTFTSTAYQITLAVAAQTVTGQSSAKVFGSMDWEEVSR